MSPDLERLVGRAVTDEAFREKLLADPKGTVKDSGYSLSDDELNRLETAANKPNAQKVDQEFKALGW